MATPRVKEILSWYAGENPGVLANLGQISSRDYGFKTKLDATPALGKLAGSGKRILVGALGGAEAVGEVVALGGGRRARAAGQAGRAGLQVRIERERVDRRNLGAVVEDVVDLVTIDRQADRTADADPWA